MKKAAYEDLIAEISKQLAEKICMEEGDLTPRVKTIDGDIAVLVRDIGLRTSKLVLQKTCDEKVVKKKAEGLKPCKSSVIDYNVIFGTMELNSPYLWKKGEASKPMVDDLGITHDGRTETVNRALTDFGIEDSFGQASKRFREHYGFRLSESTVNRVTKASGLQAEAYLEQKLLEGKDQGQESDGLSEPLLVELDGCEIRTGVFAPAEDGPEDEEPKRKKVIQWRDVRIGLARPISSKSKLYVGQMEKYPEVVSHLVCVASMLGMAEETDVVAVADGGKGLREELENQFCDLQFILDKSHLKKHLYETSEALGFKEKERHQWVHSKLDEISAGNVQEVLEDLETQNTTEPNDRLRQFIGYLTRFKDAVDYDHYKELGYPIGSGEVESSHKYIPQKRFKLPGACWHPDSINPILALRVIRANDWWDDYWAYRISGIKQAA